MVRKIVLIPEEQIPAAFLEEFEQAKKLINGQIERILFEDESMIRDYQAISNTWFLKGKQNHSHIWVTSRFQAYW